MKHMSDLGLEDSGGRHRRLAVKLGLIIACVCFTVALLRDMINWRIEQPARGKKLDPDDPKMRALEAYIMSQRKGAPMEFGKH